MSWKSILWANWPFKVAALVLAVLIWFNVSANQDRTEQDVDARLQFDFQNHDWVPVQVPTAARVAFRGRLGDILDLLANRPVIRLTIEDVADSVVRVELAPSMVLYDRRLNVQPVAVRPSTVELHFERVAEKLVPVAVRATASPAPGFTVIGPSAVEPESVKVRGGRSQVEGVSSIATEEVVLDDLTKTTSRQVALTVPDENPPLVVEPAQVLVAFRVDSLVERTVRVGVQAVGKGASSLSLTPAEVSVILSGPGSVLRGLVAEEVRAWVEVPEMPVEPRRLPVHVTLPPGVTATAQADPAVVVVSPREGER